MQSSYISHFRIGIEAGFDNDTLDIDFYRIPCSVQGNPIVG